MSYIYLNVDNTPYYGDEVLRMAIGGEPIIIDDVDFTHNTLYKNIIKIWNDNARDIIEEMYSVQEQNESVTRYLSKYFEIDIDETQLMAIKNLFNIIYTIDKQHFIKSMLFVITGKRWTYKRLYGNCQGESSIVYYIDKEYYDDEMWTYIEMAIWGGLSQVRIWETENEIENVNNLDGSDCMWSYSIYDTEYSFDKLIRDYGTEGDIVTLIEKIPTVTYKFGKRIEL